MAIKQSIARTENRTGGLFANGYFRILEVNFDRRNNKIRIRVGGFVDEDARRLASSQPNMMGDDQRIIIDKWFEKASTVEMTIAEAYAYIKTQEYFANAVDVFEAGQE